MSKIHISLFLLILPLECICQNYTFSVGGNFTSGNLFSYGLNLRANISTDSKKKHQLVFTPTFDYGKISNQQGVFELRRKEILSILNYERDLNRFKFYIYNEIEKSFLRKIYLRGAFGTGFSYKIITTESLNFDVSQLILPEIFQSSFSNRRDNWAVRLSTRIRIAHSFKKWKYSSQILYQPAIFTEMIDGTNLSIIDNTNMRINNSYEYILSKNLSLGLNGDFTLQTYPSFINPNVKPYDSNVSLFVRGNF